MADKQQQGDASNRMQGVRNSRVLITGHFVFGFEFAEILVVENRLDADKSPNPQQCGESPTRFTDKQQ
jgi:hypothetical protein